MAPLPTMRQRILDAACDIIVNDGVAATTPRAIASRAQIDQLELDEQYASHEELLVDLLLREYRGLRRDIAEDVARDPAGGLTSRIFHYALSATYERPLARALYVMDPDGLGTILRAIQGTEFAPRLQADEQFLQALQEAGMIRPDVDISALGAILSAFMFGSALTASSDVIDTTIAGLVMLLERAVDADVTDTEAGKQALYELLSRDPLD